MSGYAISPFPTMNDLLAPQHLRVQQDQQADYHQNSLLTQQHNQQVINATDVEMTARFAQTLAGMPEEEAARAYGPGIAYLQSQGFAKLAPPVFPGLEVTKRLADMGVSATEQYKTRQDAAGLATVAGAYGFNPPGSGGTATPGGGGATGQARLLPGETDDQFLARIEARESGGRNVMNYRNKEDPSKFTAGGYYQIVDSTWKAGAQAAGIDISQYPTAISAPREVQTQVARSILRNFGPQHWNQSEPGATQQANAAPRAPAGGGVPPSGVQMGGAPPGPPGGAPGPYGGGGFGTALNAPGGPQMRETFTRDADGTVRKVLVPTGGAPVATTPPAPGGGTASNVGGDVNAILGGMAQGRNTPIGGVMAAGPAAPTAPERQVSSVEPPPQPGWGTAVGSYGDGAASAPGAQQPAAPAAPVAPAPATRPPPAAAMPPELQTDNHGLTVRDRAELGGLLRAGRISPLAFQNEVQQRQNANVTRQNHWETQQTATRTEARAIHTAELADRTAARADAEAAQKAADAGKPYHGSGIEAQDSNVLLAGDDGSARYAGAYARQAAPRVNVDGSTVTPNMTAYDRPTYRGGRGQDTGGAPDYSTSRVTPPTTMNAAQGLAAGYADRIREALPVITDTSDAAMSRWQILLGKAPVLGNTLVSSDFQTHMQSERNFINAVLRRESGAAISESEFINARQQYIPQPGDKSQVLAQKAKNRETVLESLTRDAGPAYKPKTDTTKPDAATPPQYTEGQTATAADGHKLVFRNGSWGPL